MKLFITSFAKSMLLVAALASVAAAVEEGTIATFWPLFDYRSSPATGYSNLSILGPVFKMEHSGEVTRTTLRPLFFNQSDRESADSDILYPLASTSSGADYSSTQVLKIYQKHVSRAGSSEEKRDSMIFPFYISGQSEKYGPYRSFFPIHGDIYERFWRDEYHFTLFPFYGRTVKNGTTSTNWLYPFFNSLSGQDESGFQFWPLYGQSAKQGVYSKRFVLWPFYIRESIGLNSDNPTENLNLIPFYASSTSPRRTSTHMPWPFCGVVRDGRGETIERDYFWPFWVTAQGKDYSIERFIPFYANSRIKDSTSDWLAWPLYRHETINSASFRQDKTSLFYFLFTHAEESWPESGRDRARSAFWPLYAWKRDESGIRTLSMPALAEPVIWNDGVERNWAPLWRILIAKWDEQGNNAVSLLWNLYWQEKRGPELAWELSPLLSYRGGANASEFKLLKGLFGYGSDKNGSSLSLFWIPFRL